MRRVATQDGKVSPANVFKKSGDYEGLLRSLSKGSQVRWRKNLCAPCNNSRSQLFDQAYDHFEAFVVHHDDTMGQWRRLDWTAVYGELWQKGARDLARYFAKQFGCMLAGQDLHVPQDLIDFLSGADRCPSICFMVYLNWRGIDGHKMMRRHGGQGLTSFIGLLESPAWTDAGRLRRIVYGYHIGYVWLMADWTVDTDRGSWFEYPSIDLPLVNSRIWDKVAWFPQRLRGEVQHLWDRITGDPSLD